MHFSPKGQSMLLSLFFLFGTFLCSALNAQDMKSGQEFLIEEIRQEVTSSYLSKVFPDTHPFLYRLVDELSRELGITTPKIFVYKGSEALEINAFAVVHMIALGEGLINHLTYQELRAIVAHELAHLKYGHVSQKIAIQGICGAITGNVLTELYKRKYVTWQQSLIGYLGTVILLTPLFNYVSRRFEKEADLAAAKVVGADAMINSFDKLNNVTKKYRVFNKIAEDLYGKSPKFIKRLTHLLWSTHPSFKERKAYVRELDHQTA
jgi:Zn-dependent protease with chaperone function